jgi:hypothetical protein
MTRSKKEIILGGPTQKRRAALSFAITISYNYFLLLDKLCVILKKVYVLTIIVFLNKEVHDVVNHTGICSKVSPRLRSKMEFS